MAEEGQEIGAQLIDRLNKLWPIAVGVILLATWMTSRLETPDQKLARIDARLEPIRIQMANLIRDSERLDRTLSVHMEQSGHAVALNRIQALEKGLDELKTGVSEINRQLSELLRRLTPRDPP